LQQSQDGRIPPAFAGAFGRIFCCLHIDTASFSHIGHFLKEELALSIEDGRLWIDPEHSRLTIEKQCELLGLPRSTYYYQP